MISTIILRLLVQLPRKESRGERHAKDVGDIVWVDIGVAWKGSRGAMRVLGRDAWRILWEFFFCFSFDNVRLVMHFTFYKM